MFSFLFRSILYLQFTPASVYLFSLLSFFVHVAILVPASLPLVLLISVWADSLILHTKPPLKNFDSFYGVFHCNYWLLITQNWPTIVSSCTSTHPCFTRICEQTLIKYLTFILYWHIWFKPGECLSSFRTLSSQILCIFCRHKAWCHHPGLSKGRHSSCQPQCTYCWQLLCLLLPIYFGKI